MKEDLILKKLEKLDLLVDDYGFFKKDMYDFKKDMYDFKKDMYQFKKEMLAFKKTATTSLMNIENKLDIFTDMYQMNRDDINDLKIRMTAVETKLGM